MTCVCGRPMDEGQERCHECMFRHGQPGRRYAPQGAALPGRSDHGTRTCYIAGCRCRPCRDANRDYRRSVRAATT